MIRPSLTVAAFAAVALLVIGCDDKKSVTVAPAASSLAPSTPSPTNNKTLKFVVDPKSTTAIDMPAPNEHIKAGTDAATGTLDVDVMDLANTRGEIKADLTTLTTKTFGDPKKDGDQTTHARTWLEVADGESGKLPDDVKASNRYATYAIRSISNLSATDLTKVPAVKDGEDEIRTVTATTKGELLIHGHKVDKEADVEVTFRYAPGATADKPKALSIRTKKPFRVTLAEHEVKPRDGFGKIAKGAFNLLGTKVADTADISLDVKAKPQS